MSDAADIFGQPVADPDEARESFLAGVSGAVSSVDLPSSLWLPVRFSQPLTFYTRGCDFSHGHCQLGHGHAPPHCVPDPDGSGSYLMVDDNGLTLREL